MKTHSVENNFVLQVPHAYALFRILAMACLLLFICTYSLNAAKTQSLNSLITINQNNVELLHVMSDIEQQSNYLFVYNKDVDVHRNVSIHVVDKPLNTVLTDLFGESGVRFAIEGSYIVLSVAKDTAGNGMQQQIKSSDIRVLGRVVDASNEPMIGVTVKEVGTNNGVITDIDGNFSIIIKSEGASLEFSFVGYKSVVMKAEAGKEMLVRLMENSELLDEVVVVGYGTQKKANLTGAVASVDVNKALEGRPIADVGRGLQGTTPGLSIVIPSGEVGSDPVIKVRGQFASTEGSTKPLILLDNVEIPSIQLVNPDDIESISVLKDAAASSIYGAKAAFGVVLITTKKGAKTDRVNVSYQGNVSFQNTAKDMEMAQFHALEYSIEAMKRAGDTMTGSFIRMTESGLERAREWQEKYGGKLGVNDPFVYGRDWYVNEDGYKIGLRTFNPYDYMIREWAPTNQHTLSINGKSGKTTYNIGLGYLHQNGMMKPAKEDNFTRYNASVRLSTELSKHLSVRAGAIFSSRNKRYPYVTSNTKADPWLYLYRWGPNMPWGYDENGHEIRSPWSEIRSANTASRLNNYLNVNLGATIQILKGWKMDLDYTYANEENIIKSPGTRYTAANSWVDAVLKTDADGNQLYVDRNGRPVSANDPGAMPAYQYSYEEYTAPGSNPDHIRKESAHGRRHTFNATTDYNWDLNEQNNFKFLLGMNLVTYDYENNWSQITNLTDIHNPQFDLAIGNQTTGGGYSWEGQIGFFGRVNYNFMDKYLLEANLRYDGSSKFPSDLQWRWFPSFSAGWRLSEETFMLWSKPVLSSLKVRGSWGIIGDQTVSNSLYVPALGTGQVPWLGADGNKLYYRGMPAAVASDITWQDIRTVDFGFDARLFNSEFGITFDWYQRDTKNMIVPGGSVGLTFGAGSPKGNYGSLRTLGWEVTLDYNHRFSNGLGVNAMFTLSDAETEITEYGTTREIADWYVGKTYGEIWGYRTDRLYQKSDFVYDERGELVKVWALEGREVPAGTKGAKQMYKLSDPNGVYQDFLQTGDFMFGPVDVKYTDLNGDGKFSNGAGTVEDPGDREIIGNSTPRFEYGIRLGADYKGFDFSIFMQGIGKREIWGDGALAIPGYTSYGAMPETFASDYWTETNTDAFYARPWNQAESNNSNNYYKQSRYLLDMSYLRIKNITFGYSLPEYLTKKVHMQKARVYLALENFFTFDNLNGLPIDPEVISGYSMFNTSDYNAGRTGVGTPAFKSVSVGVQLNF